ncbi:MAG: hypothetical protein AAGI38_07490 [Bacteroidota bacterium]
MNLSGFTLLCPDKKPDNISDLIDFWKNAGGYVRTIGDWWEAPMLDPENVVLYGNTSFCMVLAHFYGLELSTPDNSFIATLTQDWLKREVTFHSDRDEGYQKQEKETLEFNWKIRTFIDSKTVRCFAPYSGVYPYFPVTEFLNTFIQEHSNSLPGSMALDVGYIPGRGWAILDVKPVWCASPFNCEPEGMCQSLLAAHQPTKMAS